MDRDNDNYHLKGGILPNAHPEAAPHQGEHYTVPHPPREDHINKPKSKSFSDAGWRGTPEIPSREGGDEEKDFMSKPPYWWKSEGNKFIPGYTT